MINIGIIGCGKISQARHIPEVTENPYATVYGVTDLNKERAKEVAKGIGAKVYSDYKEMLADSNIDAVIICSANCTHAEIACASLEAKKHVLCEKPVADTVENAEKIRACVNKTKMKFMVAQNQRYDVVHSWAKDIVDSGKLGKILRFESNFLTNGPENWSVDGAKNLWFFDKAKAGMGAMGDVGIHKVDLVRYMLGEKFTQVSSFLSTLDKKDSEGNPIEVEDSAVILLKAKSGILGTVSVGWTFYGEGMDNSTTLFMEKGIIKMYKSLSENQGIIEHINGDKEIFCPINIWGNSQIANKFIDCIANDTASPVPIDEAIEVLKTVEACFESSKSKKVVTL